MTPVRKTLELACSQTHAFEVFTHRVSLWWPLASHSCGEDRAQSVEVEPRIGGHWRETTVDGALHLWGTVLTWDPPNGFSSTWHPGFGPDQATHLIVQFIAIDEHRCRLELLHGGWEARGEEADAMRKGYEKGWDFVLGEFVRSLP